MERAKRWRHPRALGPADVAAFLNHLASVESVAAGTLNQALNASSFLYTQLLGMDLDDLDEFLLARQRRRVPTVLSKALIKRDGARCRFRTCDPYRVKVMLYH